MRNYKSEAQKHNPDFQRRDEADKIKEDITWVDAELVCNITVTEITDDGSARHPVFQGLRVDKIAQDVALEKPISKT